MEATTENNKLIAEFISSENTYHVGHYICPNGIATEPKDMKFHSDWNWLMEVVEKCYETEASYNLHKNIEDAFIYKTEKRIEAVYNACVEFVKYQK
jgi:hypothetical protein